MTIRCSKCGGRIPDGVSLFCHHCGARLDGENASDYPVCPRCGRSYPDRNSRYCDHCGVKLVPPARLLSQNSTMHPVRTCQACGHPNPGDDIRYCNKCGRPLIVEMPSGPLKHRESRNSPLEPDIMDGAAGQENIQKKKPVQKAGPLSRFYREGILESCDGHSDFLPYPCCWFFYHNRGIRKQDGFRIGLIAKCQQSRAVAFWEPVWCCSGEFICGEQACCDGNGKFCNPFSYKDSSTFFKQGGTCGHREIPESKIKRRSQENIPQSRTDKPRRCGDQRFFLHNPTKCRNMPALATGCRWV